MGREFGRDITQEVVKNQYTTPTSGKKKKVVRVRSAKKTPQQATSNKKDVYNYSWTSVHACTPNPASVKKKQLPPPPPAPHESPDGGGFEYTITFQPGPIGLQLEPVLEAQGVQVGCRVLRFTEGPAQSLRKIRLGDLLIAVNHSSVVDWAYPDVIRFLKLLPATQSKSLTFRTTTVDNNFRDAQDRDDEISHVPREKSENANASPTSNRAASRLYQATQELSPTNQFSPSKVKELSMISASMGDISWESCETSKTAGGILNKLGQVLMTGTSSKEFQNAVRLKMQLLTELSHAKITLDAKAQEKHRMDVLVRDLAAELDLTRLEIKSLQRTSIEEREHYQQMIQELKSRHDDELERQKQLSDQQRRSWDQREASLTFENHQLQGEKQSLFNQVESMRGTHRMMETSLQTLQSENKARVAEQNSIIKDLQGQNDHLQSLLKETKSQHESQLKQLRQDIYEQRLDWDQEKAAMQLDLQHLERERQCLMLHSESEQAARRELEQALETLRSGTEYESTQHQDIVANLQTDLRTTKTERDRLEAVLLDLKTRHQKERIHHERDWERQLVMQEEEKLSLMKWIEKLSNEKDSLSIVADIGHKLVEDREAAIENRYLDLVNRMKEDEGFIRQLEEQLESSKREQDRLEGLLHDANREREEAAAEHYEELEYRLKEWHRTQEQMKQQVEHLTLERELLESRAGDHELQHLSLESEVQKLWSERNSLEERLSLLECEHHRSESLLVDARSEIESLLTQRRHDLEQSQSHLNDVKESLTEQVAMLEEENHAFLHAAESSRKARQQVERSLEVLQAELDACIEEKDRRIADLENQLHTLVEKNSETSAASVLEMLRYKSLTSKIEEVRSEKQVLLKKIDNERLLRQEAETSLRDMKEQLIRTNSKIDSLDKQLHQKQHDINSLLEAEVELQAELRSNDSVMHSMKAELEERAIRSDVQVKVIETLQLKLSDDLSDFTSQLAQQTALIQEIEEKLARVSAENKSLSLSYSQEKAKKDELKVALSRFMSQAEDMVHRREVSAFESKELRMKLASQSEANALLSTKITELEAEIELVAQDKAKFQQLYFNEAKGISEQKSALEREMNMMHHDMNMLKERVAQMSEREVEMSRRIEELQDELGSITNERVALELMHDREKGKNEHLHSLLSDKHRELAETGSLLESAKDELRLIRSVMETQSATSREMTSELITLEEEILTMAMEKTDLEFSFASENAKCTELEQMVQRMKFQLDRKDSSLRDTIEQLQLLDDVANTAHERSLLLQCDLEDTRKELATVRRVFDLEVNDWKELVANIDLECRAQQAIAADQKAQIEKLIKSIKDGDKEAEILAEKVLKYCEELEQSEMARNVLQSELEEAKRTMSDHDEASVFLQKRVFELEDFKKANTEKASGHEKDHDSYFVNATKSGLAKIPISASTNPMESSLRISAAGMIMENFLRNQDKAILGSAFRQWSSSTKAMSAVTLYVRSVETMAQQLHATRAKLIALKTHMKANERRKRGTSSTN
jgi:chromosome segregation ATPase